MTPLPHQLHNSRLLIQALSKYGAALDASETGTGKTATVVFVAKQLEAKLAVVCPLACVPSWERTCKAIGVEPLFVSNYESCRSTKFPFGGVVAKGNKRNYEWRIPEPRVIFVFDEVHRCRGRKTINSMMLLAASKRYKTVMLSATPFTDPMEAFAIGASLKLFPQNDYFGWMLRHGVRKNHFGHFEFLGHEGHITKIHAAIFPERGVRTKHEDIPGFPETQVVAEAIETGEAGAIESIYLEALEKKVAAETAELAGFEMEVQGVTQYLRERQRIELLKCQAMVDLAIDARDKGHSVALFVNFKDTVKALRGLLKTDDVIEGGQHNFERARVVDLFGRNRIDFVIVNNAAGGTGLDLHDTLGTKRERTSLIFPPLSPVVLKQVLGRPHRQGGGFSQQRLLFAAGTLEEKRIMPRIQAKLTNLDLLVNGDLDFSVE